MVQKIRVGEWFCMRFCSDIDSTKLTNKKSKRLAYIDFKLFFTGHVSRADLNEVFGIAEAASSRALTEYSALRPKNKVQKTNTIIRDSFNPLIEFDAEQALGMLAHGFNSNMRFNEAELTYEGIGKIPNRLNVD
ncbi:transcriptional regulator, partial [Vibrio rotiferianus]